MRKEVNSLIETARSYFGVSKTASVVSDFVISSALARALPLPSSEVSSAKVYYAESYASRVVTVADHASRHALVSVNRIIRLTETLWTARYQSVYAPPKFGVLFGLDTEELGDPDLADAVDAGALRTFLLKRDMRIQPACEAIEAYLSGLSIEEQQPEVGTAEE